jgi:hypothetical protein
MYSKYTHKKFAVSQYLQEILQRITTAKTRHSEKDKHDRTARMDSHERTTRTGKPGKDNKDRTNRTYSQDIIAINGPPGKDSQDRAEQPGQK